MNKGITGRMTVGFRVAHAAGFGARLATGIGAVTLWLGAGSAAAAGPALTASSTAVPTGGTVTASWSAVSSPSPTDWIGVYVPGSSSQSYGNWLYDDSCTQMPGSSAQAAGSCAIALPGTPGTYELRLLAANGYTVLASSGPITVSAPAAAALAASPAAVSPGGKLTVTWSGVSAPSATDWVGLYAPGAPAGSYLGWFYDSSCTQSAATSAGASGSCSYTLPAALAPGAYQLRLEARNGYTVLASSGQITVGTPSSSPAGDPVVVAVGDIACAPGDVSDSCRQAETAGLAGAQHPSDVLVLGDNQYNSGLLGEYDGPGAYNATWGAFNAIVRPVAGNHEYAASSSAAGFFEYFGSAAHGPGGYYSFNVGGWHIIALNSDCSDAGCSDSLVGTTSSAQLSWLKADLAADQSQCVLAYWHHPQFSSGFVGDSPGVAPLWSALYAAHADVVLGGHDHLYERYAPQDPSGTATAAGIREFVVGTGGEYLMPLTKPESNLQFADTSDFGVLALTLHPGSYDWAFKALDGTVVDSGSAACHAAGSAIAPQQRVPHRWRALAEPRLALGIRSLRPVRRGGGWLAPLEVHCSRACDLLLVAWSHGRRVGAWQETESQIRDPYSRLVLRLPVPVAGGALVLRAVGEDAAAERVRSAVTVRLGGR
jgi:uncharacterized protein YegP (UPF0339 family)